MMLSTRRLVLTLQVSIASALLWMAPSNAADLHDEMQGRWFVTEVIVFERPRIGLIHGGEPLLSETEWRWPLDMHLIRRSSRDGAVLDPIAHRQRDTLKLLTSGTLSQAQPELDSAPSDSGTVENDWRAQLNDLETELAEQGTVWLDASALTMTSHRRDIERRLGASILFHGAWRQDVPGREEPYPIMLSEPNGSLFGTLSVTVNRFLHVNASLNFPVTGSAVILDASGQPLSSEGEAADDGSADDRQPPMQQVSGVMRLAESRRVRSEELHYLDHPRFGVLLRIQEIGFPETLETAWRERSR